MNVKHIIGLDKRYGCHLVLDNDEEWQVDVTTVITLKNFSVGEGDYLEVKADILEADTDSEFEKGGELTLEFSFEQVNLIKEFYQIP